MDIADDDEDMALAVILNLLFENEDANEDGDEDNEVFQIVRGPGNEDARVWQLMDDIKFHDDFRMDKPLFGRLLFTVENHLIQRRRIVRRGTPVAFSVLFTLWILANPDSFRTTGKNFDKAKSTIHYHYKIVIECLRELASRYVRWPDARERDEIKFQVERRRGYPGVVGAIDGTNIHITAPLQQKRRYVDRHHRYAVTVQAVCDHNKLYRDIFVAQPGSVGDARTYTRSPLSRRLLMGPPYINEDEVILGDGAYMLLNHLMKPYAQTGRLDRRRRRHNRIHAASRSSLVECSFALLKGKNQRLMRRLHTESFRSASDQMMDPLQGSLKRLGFKELIRENSSPTFCTSEDEDLDDVGGENPDDVEGDDPDDVEGNNPDDAEGNNPDEAER